MLLDAVWPGVVVSDSMPATCVAELRRALGDDARTPRFIDTVHRRGYRFIAQVTTTATGREVKRQSSRLPKSPKSMVGRKMELAQLRNSYSQVLEGQRLILFVTGEAGIGKTTLVKEFLDSIESEGTARVGRGQCVEQYGSGEPYMPVLEALSRLSHEDGGEQVIEVLSRFAPTWLTQMPELLTPEERVRLQNEMQGITQQRMLREMTQALEALSAETPIVLLLEDLHWSDFSTLELISSIARRSEPARMLIVGTYRPVEILTNDHPLRTMKQELELHHYCEELRLKPLSEENVVDYLTGRLARDGSRQFRTLAPVIHARTDGNPLFMVNMVDYLLDDAGLLLKSREVSEAEWAKTLRVHRLDALSSIRQMIERNLERLRPEEQAVLEGASVAGAEFSAAAVAAALERPQNEIEAYFKRLSRREQFVSEQGPIVWPDGTVAAGFRFHHALYQEVLYGRLSVGYQVQLHRLIAAREEAGYGERAGEIATELAHHYTRANDKNKAIHYFQLAGEQAAAKGADGATLAQLGAALELVAKLPDDPTSRLQEIRLRILIGPSLMAVKGLGSSETAANYTRASELCRLAGDTAALFEALSGLWTFHLVRAEHSEAGALVQQLLASTLESKDNSHLAFANFAAGNTAFWSGQFETAAARLARSIAACKPGQRLYQVFVDDPAVYSRAYLAWTQHYRGHSDQALVTIRDCLQVARMLSHPRTLAMATQFAGHLHLFRREPGKVVEHCRMLTSLASEHGLPFYGALAEILAGCAAVQSGNGARGVEAIKHGIDAWQSLGSALGVPWFLGEFAEALRSIGRCDEALDIVSDALRQTEGSGERQFAAELHRIAGTALMTQGRPAEAENSFRRAIEIARSQGARMWELRATTTLASMLAKQGNRAEARTMLAEIYGWSTEGFDLADLKDAEALLDELSHKPKVPRRSDESSKVP
jgi:predicted ATPase